MTNKKREKKCIECDSVFTERPSDSNSQWGKRLFCSMRCNNTSNTRVTPIFDRLERFQIKSESGCWSWSGSKDGKGYGTLSNRLGSKFGPEKAHRVSYEKEFGEIADGMNICHKCDNPECTNPEHLFAGTQKDNMQDCSGKGRLNKKSLLNLKSNKAVQNGFKRC